ncbi:MAG: hypothetical protein HYT10_03100 [Candidatus Levybacteria bacterium]|nr:hypothetical protein [Candidatus Levybacteria bacterium]
MRSPDFAPIEIHGQKQPFSPVAQVPDREIFETISCTGVRDVFAVEDMSISDDASYKPMENPKTGATHWVREQELRDREGGVYQVLFSYDLDNREVAIVREDNGYGPVTVARLNLRDRTHDGTPASTPPQFLKVEDAPVRSHFIGGTLWDYSNAQVDKQPPGRKSIEISRASSDPSKVIFDSLRNKEHKMTVGAHELSDFIDDPFAALPLEDPTPEKLEHWYRLWWQVANRGLRGKWIAYPGQVSERGFKNFSAHVLNNLTQVLGEREYSHISSVPTWLYVWRMNLNGSGFSADDPKHHQEALAFWERLRRVEIPVFDNGHAGERIRVNQLSDKDPIISWLGVLPFALQLDPDIKPKVAMQKNHQEAFDEVMDSVKKYLILPDREVVTYPLAPDRNLWHSKPITKENG